MFNKIGYPPKHKYIWVDTAYTHEDSLGFQEAMWVGITAIPSRMWGINVVFREGGMLYRNVPPHAVAFRPDPWADWSPRQSQMWDCYSQQFSTLENDHLSGLRVSVITEGEVYEGKYLFSTAHYGDGWSECPEQDKEFLWCELDNGRLTIQPTNRVVFIDKSFIVNKNPLPRLKLSDRIYSVE